MRARDWREIEDLAEPFVAELTAAKLEADPNLAWYPYQTLAQLDAVGTLLNQAGEPFESLAAGGPVLDLGCGDGDLSFLLARAGYEVIAVDHRKSNYNGMAGVRLLHQRYPESITLIEKDLDQPFEPPEITGSFAFLLGILYHLENPLQALRWLAARADYCLLSTRVANVVHDEPVAYLTDEAELNDDNSNFWLFTPGGLRRLLRRAGWSLLSLDLRADSSDANDRRAYCLAKTTRALRNIETAYGWTSSEGQTWRWTFPRFAAWVKPPLGVREARLALRLFLPVEQLSQTGPLVIEATAAGRPLGAQTFAAPGERIYQVPVTSLAGDGAPLFVTFTVDKPFLPPPPDRRELGVIIYGLDLS